MNFCKNVVVLREQKKISQSELGALIGISDAEMAQYENQEISLPIELAIKIARVLDVSLDGLAFGQEEVGAEIYKKFVFISSLPKDEKSNFMELINRAEHELNKSNMSLNNLGQKKEILSTADEKKVFQKEHSLSYLDQKITFSFDDLRAFDDLVSRLSDKEISGIVKDLKLKKGLMTFKASNGLSVYGKIEADHILIFSAGETQPSLYKMFIEGIFQRKS